MKRSDIVADYKVSKSGRITSPGKFEGEMVYMPHFYEVYLDGWCDREHPHIYIKVSDEDRADFPELKGRRSVRFNIRDDGFIEEIRAK